MPGGRSRASKVASAQGAMRSARDQIECQRLWKESQTNLQAGSGRPGNAGDRTLRPLSRPAAASRRRHGAPASLPPSRRWSCEALDLTSSQAHIPGAQDMPPAAMSGVQLASRNRRPCCASSKSTLPRHSRASRMCRNGTHARPLNSALEKSGSGATTKQFFRKACGLPLLPATHSGCPAMWVAHS